MKLEKIIDLLGEVKNCNYIVRKMLEPNKTFKGFVTYTIELYKVESNPTLILSVYKVLTPKNKEKEQEAIEEEFIKKVFSYALQ